MFRKTESCSDLTYQRARLCHKGEFLRNEEGCQVGQGPDVGGGSGGDLAASVVLHRSTAAQVGAEAGRQLRQRAAGQCEEQQQTGDVEPAN